MGSMHAFPVPTHCGRCEKSKKTHKAKVKQSTDIATSLSVQHTGGRVFPREGISGF